MAIIFHGYVTPLSITIFLFFFAVSTLVSAGLFFFLFRKPAIERRRRHKIEKTHIISSPSCDEEMAVSFDAINLVNGTLKGLIVEENGLDVLYWIKLESGDGMGRKGYRKEVLDRSRILSNSSKSSAASSSKLSLPKLRDPDRVGLMGAEAPSQLPFPPPPFSASTPPPPPPPTPPLPVHIKKA